MDRNNNIFNNLPKYKYEFKTKPNKHQLYELKKMWQKENWAHFWQMRTRKTKVVIDNAGILFGLDKINIVVAIPKKGSYHNWEKEVEKHLPDTISVIVKRWINGKWIEKYVNHNGGKKYLRFFIINVEAFSRKTHVKFFNDLCINNKVLMAIDESTSIKGKSNRTKNIQNISQHAKYRRILTGTPIPNAPLDLYEQCKFLDNKLLGFSSFYSFKARYAITQDIYIRDHRDKTKKRKIKINVGYRRLDDLYHRLSKFSSRLLRKDCTDLSQEKQYEMRYVELTKEQLEAYSKVAEQGLYECEQGMTSVLHQLTLRMRLHEICCGQLTLDDGNILKFPTNKIKELDDIIEECGGKIIIWAHYVANIKELEKHLRNKYGKQSVVTYYGATSTEDRVKAEESFQAGDSPVRFFLGNQSTGGYGLTLTSAELIVYFANTNNAEHRDQSEERADDMDSPNTIPIIDLVCRGTQDEEIARNLQNKNRTSGLLFNEDPKKWFSIPKKQS